MGPILEKRVKEAQRCRADKRYLHVNCAFEFHEDMGNFGVKIWNLPTKYGVGTTERKFSFDYKRTLILDNQAKG